MGSVCSAEWRTGKLFHTVEVPLDSTSLYLEQVDTVGGHRLTYTSFRTFTATYYKLTEGPREMLNKNEEGMERRKEGRREGERDADRIG